jgi:hypothetical protein
MYIISHSVKNISSIYARLIHQPHNSFDDAYILTQNKVMFSFSLKTDVDRFSLNPIGNVSSY